MANEVEIVVTGSDRTGNMFASVKGNIGGLSRSFSDLKNNVRSSFTSIQNDIHSKLAASVTAAKSQGKSIGSALVGQMSDAVKQGASNFKSTMSSVFNGAMQGALATPIVGPVIIAAVGSVATVLAPVLGGIVGGALTLGIGAGIVGAATAALFYTEEVDKSWSKSEQKRVTESNKQAEKLKAQWRETSRSVINGVKEAAQPLIPVLDTVREQVSKVGKVFKPVVESALAMSEGPLKDFAENLGKGIEKLAPAVKPAMEAFNQLLDEIGPQLPTVFKDIADAVIDLSNSVIENKDIIGAIFIGLLEAIPVTISAISNLTQFLDTLMNFSVDAFSTVGVAALNMADVVMGAVESMLSGLAAIPGPWQDSMKAAVASIQETRATLNAYKGDIENLPKVFKLQGDIKDLQSKLSTAKRQLSDPNLTKERRASIRAEIAQLKVAIAQAKGAIASVQGKTVNVHVRYTSSGRSVINGVASVGAHDRRHGGVVGGGISAFATGGISGAGGATALVGEEGPELVRLPYGSSVVPSGQTKAMMAAQSGASGMNRASTSFRSAVADPMADTVKTLAKALKEVLSLREAMGNLTKDIFGQERALSGYEGAWDAALKSLKEHKKTLSITTEAGRANRSALMNLAESAHEVIFSMRDLDKSVPSMMSKMKEQRAEFIKMARAMGMSADAAKKLADRYGLVPSKIKAATTAEAKANAYNTSAKKFNDAIGAAGGGPRSGLTLVGELGPELVRLPSGSQVMPSGQDMGFTGGSGAAQILHITLQIGSTVLGELMLDPLRKTIRTRGGNVQAVLGKG